MFASLIVLFKIILLIIIISTFSDSNNYYGQPQDKPKLILVGASNMDHNFDYELINKHFSNYNVIGCNLNEPSGFFAIFTKLKKLQPSKKDIVVFCLPHSLYESATFLPIDNPKKVGFSSNLLYQSFCAFPLETLKNCFSRSKIMTIHKIHQTDFKNEAPADTISFGKKSPVESDSIYLSCIASKEDKFFINSPGFEKDYLSKLATFVSQELEAKVLYRFPAIKEKEYEIDQDRLSFLVKELHFMNRFESSIYKTEYWYNQWYHLNKCGKEVNSKKFISELSDILNQ